MSPRGDIINLADEVNEQLKKECVRIPDEELNVVQKMNRADRRKWYKENKKDPTKITTEE